MCYVDFAHVICHRFNDASGPLRELFARIVFNILCGNTDDHARNDAAFWDGLRLSLTPAYDICPQSRAGQEASQAMLISENNRFSRIATCLDAAHHFLLSETQAMEIVERQLRCIGANWRAVCNDASLTETDRNLLWGRQFLNLYAFTALDDPAGQLSTLVDEIRKTEV